MRSSACTTSSPSGHDVRRVADDLLRTFRDAFLQANASGRVPYDGAPEDCERLAALAKEMGNAAVVRAIEILGDAIVDIRGQAVADPRLVLEVAVVRIARARPRTREETLLDRVERLEQRLADGAPAGDAPMRAAAPASAPAAAAPARPAPRPAVRCSPGANARPRGTPRGPDTEVAAEDDAPARPSRLRSRRPYVRPRRRHRGVAEALGLLKAPVRAGIQDAQPIALEDGIIVFGVPKRRFDAINERFRKEAAAIKEAFASGSALRRASCCARTTSTRPTPCVRHPATRLRRASDASR